MSLCDTSFGEIELDFHPAENSFLGFEQPEELLPPATDFHKTSPLSTPLPLPLQKDSEPIACPCCSADIDPSSEDYHAHVSKCYLEKQAPMLNEKATLKSVDKKGVRSQIQSIRKNLASLTMVRRIALLESLNRLAHPAKGSCLSHRTQEADVFAISLLYESSPKKTEDLKIDLNAPRRNSLSRETCTPTVQATTPTSMMKFMPRSAQKRKMLDFDEDHLDAQPPSSGFLKRFRL